MLSVIPVHNEIALKEQFKMNLKMEIVKRKEIKNKTYYFYDDIINIEEFDSNFLKIDKKSYKVVIDIYHIRYTTIKKNW